MATAQDIIDRVRAALDREPLEGESAATQAEVAESPTRTVADDFLLRAIHQGQEALAARCAALYLQPLVESYEGALSGFDEGLMLRPLEVLREGVWCRARRPEQHAEMEASARAATATYPAYVWDGSALAVYPEDGAVRVRYVKEPERVAAADALSVSPALEGALFLFATAKAWRELERPDLHALYMSLHRRWRAPFLRSFRLGRPEDYEAGRRIDELEVTTE